ncbi:lipopolysaccharide biosynthesis protein [Nonomuraea helvata]|uniref:Lipopolysaccharide biosynthesis protein n=1 Tax=Nonomuraea helvata TaxID=37484 RepID=A0ABV5S931_9ACTN
MTSLRETVIRHARMPARRQLWTFAWLAVGSQGEAILSVLSTIALARTTTASEAGKVFFAQSLMSVWFLLCDPRLEDAAQRYVPLQQSRDGGGAALFGRLLRWDVGIGAGASGVALLITLAGYQIGGVPGDLAVLLTLAIITGGAISSTGSAGAAFALTGRLKWLGRVRLRCAVVLFLLTLGGLLVGGPAGYLAGQAAGALVTAAVLAREAMKSIHSTYGPPVPGVAMPTGLVRFSVKASTATSAAAASESGLLALAGVVGGPTLVTILKISLAPARIYTSLISPVASMLQPRLAEAAAVGEGRRIRTDVTRSSLALGALGAGALVAAAPFIGPALGLAYGPSYAQTGTAALLLLAVACAKGGVSWSKVLPLAIGKPGWRLAFLTIEGLLNLGLLLAAVWVAPEPIATAVTFGWGALALTVLGSAFWVLSLRRLVVCHD